MIGCAQRIGFLTLTTCNDPVVAACGGCGKPICAVHLHSDLSGQRCPDCAVIGLDADEASRRGLDSAYYRQSANRDTDFTTYSSSDYQNFDTFAGEGGEMGGAGASGEWDADDSGPDADSSDSGSAGDFQDS
jgi:hypothetical protein